MFTNDSVNRNELMLATHTRSCVIWYANVHQTSISPSRLTQFQVEEILFIFNLKPVDQNEKNSQNSPTQCELSLSAVSPGEMLLRTTLSQLGVSPTSPNLLAFFPLLELSKVSRLRVVLMLRGKNV